MSGKMECKEISFDIGKEDLRAAVYFFFLLDLDRAEQKNGQFAILSVLCYNY